MPPEIIVDPALIDTSKILVDKAGINAVLPQRFEMEHLDAIVYSDTVNHVMIGYKDVRHDEFWVRGHLPGNPLLPGVIMCEAAAQLCSYYVIINKITNAEFVGFGGIDNVRFRAPVRPGDRFILVCKGVKLHRRQSTFHVQGFVGTTLIFNGDIIGIAMPRMPQAAAESPQ